MKFIHPMEKSLNNQFYELEKEALDIMMGEVNTIISDYADKVCHEKYLKVQEESKKLLGIGNRITDVIIFSEIIEEYCTQIDVFNAVEDDIIEFFAMKSKFRADIYKKSFEYIREKVEKMKGIIYIQEHNNMQRSALNLKFSLNKTTQSISYLMIQILDATANTYADLIVNLIVETYEKSKIKKEEINQMTKEWEKDYKDYKDYKEYAEKYKKEERKLIKIHEYDKMVGVLIGLGYKHDHSTASHHIYTNAQNKHSVPVPKHGKDINKDLCYGIQKEIRVI